MMMAICRATICPARDQRGAAGQAHERIALARLEGAAEAAAVAADLVAHEREEVLVEVEPEVRVLVEDDFGQQAIDGHDRHLSGDRDAAIRQHVDLFTGIQFVVLEASRRIGGVFLEAAGGLLDGRDVNLEVRIESAEADGNQPGVAGLQKFPIETNPIEGGGILLRKGLQMRAEGHAREATRGLVEGGALNDAIEGGGQIRR